MSGYWSQSDRRRTESDDDYNEGRLARYYAATAGAAAAPQAQQRTEDAGQVHYAAAAGAGVAAAPQQPWGVAGGAQLQAVALPAGSFGGLQAVVIPASATSQLTSQIHGLVSRQQQEQQQEQERSEQAQEQLQNAYIAAAANQQQQNVVAALHQRLAALQQYNQQNPAPAPPSQSSSPLLQHIQSHRRTPVHGERGGGLGSSRRSPASIRPKAGPTSAKKASNNDRYLSAASRPAGTPSALRLSGSDSKVYSSVPKQKNTHHRPLAPPGASLERPSKLSKVSSAAARATMESPLSLSQSQQSKNKKFAKLTGATKHVVGSSPHKPIVLDEGPATPPGGAPATATAPVVAVASLADVVKQLPSSRNIAAAKAPPGSKKTSSTAAKASAGGKKKKSSNKKAKDEYPRVDVLKLALLADVLTGKNMGRTHEIPASTLSECSTLIGLSNFQLKLLADMVKARTATAAEGYDVMEMMTEDEEIRRLNRENDRLKKTNMVAVDEGKRLKLENDQLKKKLETQQKATKKAKKVQPSEERRLYERALRSYMIASVHALKNVKQHDSEK